MLDVAAGRGALLFPAAARVGPTGHVTGIDFAPNMVRETAKEIENRNPRNAEIGQMDAEQMNLTLVRHSITYCAALRFGCSAIPSAC